jgi:hypothetical protein
VEQGFLEIISDIPVECHQPAPDVIRRIFFREVRTWDFSVASGSARRRGSSEALPESRASPMEGPSQITETSLCSRALERAA